MSLLYVMNLWDDLNEGITSTNEVTFRTPVCCAVEMFHFQTRTFIFPTAPYYFGSTYLTVKDRTYVRIRQVDQ